MATIQEHNNQIMKVILNGSDHLKHVLTDESIRRMTAIENRYPLTKLPVCPHCERLAMWGEGGCGICRKCGTITKRPITYAEYLAHGYDIDATGATAKAVLAQQKEVRRIYLPDYGL